jgi:multidrug efflux system outer membrane protein
MISLAGCAVGPGFKEPVMETPDRFLFDTLTVVSPVDTLTADSLADVRWWEAFEDPALDSLVTIALTENKGVLIAASRIEEARAALGFTRADIFPRVDVEAGATRGNLAGPNKTETAASNFFAAAALNWEIDFWGKFRRANEAAASELLATEYSFRSVRLSLIAEVVGTYFLLLDYNQRLEISQRTLESRMGSLDIIQKRFDRGIIPELDLNQAQIQKEIAAGSIPVHRRLIAKTENALSILLGRFPTDLEVDDDPAIETVPPEIPPGLPSDLLERRPDIVQARYLLQAQNARIGVAQALRLPAISLTGILGVASDDLSTLTSGGGAWSVGGSLVGPLFNFGKNARRVDIEEERTLQALYRYENTVLLAFREVEDTLVEIQTYREQMEATERKLKAARSAAFLSKERYDKGVTSYLEVLDTERTLFSVELELSELKQIYLNTYVTLYKALGGGWASQ